jgi:hypothetical protein
MNVSDGSYDFFILLFFLVLILYSIRVVGDILVGIKNELKEIHTTLKKNQD